jgi:riboflavin synthase
VFTGLVREVGRVAVADGGRLVVECGVEAEVGDSVALDGVCLTVVERAPGRLAFDVVPETLARVKPYRERVNVEPALRAGEPLGGHYVQGHVDGVGTVERVEPEGDGVRLALAAPGLARYLVEKGSVAVDGVSLTVAALTATGCEVALVPHTLTATTLADLRPGDAVNLEADVLAKYVERLLEARVQA